MSSKPRKGHFFPFISRRISRATPAAAPACPKCCPSSHALSVDQNGSLTCQPAASPPLPAVPLRSAPGCRKVREDASTAEARFYVSHWPSCEGLDGDEWSYDVHHADSLELDAVYASEYVLHVGLNRTRRDMVRKRGDVRLH